jgi:hypothetical protein
MAFASYARGKRQHKVNCVDAPAPSFLKVDVVIKFGIVVEACLPNFHHIVVKFLRTQIDT